MSASRRESPEGEELPLVFPGVVESAEVKIWRPIAAGLREKIGASMFERWFSRVTVERVEPSPMVLRVPGLMHQYWIEEHYLPLLSSVLEKVPGAPTQVEFVVVTDPVAEEAPPLREAARGAERLLTDDESVEVVEGPLFKNEARFTRSITAAGLHSRFSFDSFVVGPNCSYSFAAARAVAEKPGKTYNPLFLHGSVGLGKTHLMQAIGQEILRTKPKKVVRYVTSETFTNEYIEALRQHRISAFREKYRKVDVLMIDDIQFFAGKGSTQEEVFHTFNDLFNSFKQIILTSDRAPSDIKNLEDRLMSRFEWGMTTMIESPDVETRTAILKQKMIDWQVPAEEWVLNYLADNIRTNVRRLEGALMRVAGHLSLAHQAEPLTREMLDTLLADIMEESDSKAISIDYIQKVVADHFDLRLADINGSRRPASISVPRHIAMYLARQLTKVSLKDIGEAFGGRDHGTVIHACKVVAKKISAKEDFRQLVSSLMEQVKKPA